ncbi:MAG TPA: MBL fold metallo-hydrolase [Thermoplasmatales archaeon]|nr:MBL fold metallo-hydrolase [Thermoplasmatales archaeon]
MRLTVVYDNEVYRRDAGLKSDWGFSCLIEKDDEVILFDTGAKGEILLSNMRNLDIDPSRINKVVLSHEHWDHTGGLKALESFLGEVELYRLGGEAPSETMHLVVVEDAQVIVDGVYTTGRLEGFVDEQALVLRGRKGLYVLVGCSHPGVERILDAAKRYGEVVGLMGGFHDFSNLSILRGLDFISPCHCTRYKRRIMDLYPDTCGKCGVGMVVEI